MKTATLGDQRILTNAKDPGYHYIRYTLPFSG